MAFTVPVAISIVGDARLVRNVYRPASPLTVGQTFISYVADLEGISRLILRSTIGTDFSEVTVPVDVKGIDSYSISCREDGTMLICWSDRTTIRRFTFDPMMPATAGAQADMAMGNNPELSTIVGGKVQIFYTRHFLVYRKVSLDSGTTWGVERTISDPSNTTFDRYGMSQKPGSTQFNYLADVGFGPKDINGIALPLSVDGNTTFLMNGSTVGTETVTYGPYKDATNAYTMDDANMSGSNILDVVGSVQMNLDTGTNGTTAGKIGQARTFNGSTRWRAPNTSDLVFAGDLTLRFWVKINSYGRYHHIVARNYWDTYAVIIGTAGYLYMYWGVNTSVYEAVGLGDGTIQVGQWYHVAFTRDMSLSVAKLYLNGVLATSSPVTLTPTNNGNYTYFGWCPWTNHYTDASVDEILFNNRVLTDAEILSSYTLGNAGTADSSSTSVVLPKFSDVPNTVVYHNTTGTVQSVPARNQNGIQTVGKTQFDAASATFTDIFATGATTFEIWAKIGTKNTPDDVMLECTNGSLTTTDGMWSIGFQNDRRLLFTYHGQLRAAGTVTVTSGSGTITGSGTFFTTEFKPGDYVRFSPSSTVYQINSISSDTVLNLTAAYALPTLTTQTMYKVGQHILKQRTPATDYREGSFNFYGLSIDGSISGVTLVLNGYKMKTYWHVNPMNIPVAGSHTYASRYREAVGTVLDSIRISNVAKSLTTMRNYFKGIIL